MDRTSGTHPMIDRDDVHEIYAEWRAVFDEYDPPRTAVAEAWVETPERRAKYASAEGLGQAFNFDLLVADYDAAQFRIIIADNLQQAQATGSSTTWVLSNHDVTRHATRYGLPALNGRPVKQGTEWVKAGGPAEGLDRDGGLRRAHAATLLLLGLPGSTYLYQGGARAARGGADHPGAASGPRLLPRCRVRRSGPRRMPRAAAVDRGGLVLGFGAGGAHLPQPAWFAQYAVDAEASDPSSTLSLYREALCLRHLLQTDETLEWIDTGRADVLRFARPNGWQVVSNFGAEPFDLGADAADAVLASLPLEGSALPGESTAWIAPAALRA